MKKEKYLLAVSGGPDSMLLLNEYKDKDIVVAHVNYHKREDSDEDELIVRIFCDKHNIPLEIKEVTETATGNFQAWARELRYEFFQFIYFKHNCSKLLLAHHKDDFLETALMQMESGKTPRHFGIRQKNVIDHVNIERPFLNLYWKDEIIKINKKRNIAYATDYTNDLPIYERNKIREQISKFSPKEKRDRYQWFLMSNKILRKKFHRVDRTFSKWAETDFSLDFFRNLKRDANEVAFEYIHHHFNDIKVSGGKIEGLVDFIRGPEGNKWFELNSSSKILKADGHLKI